MNQSPQFENDGGGRREAALLRRAERERRAREEAEALLEKKSLELYQLNEALEKTVRLRTSQLEEALAKAEAATSAKSEFLAVMSHEIRTPLNGIIGLADLLNSEDLPAESLRLSDLIRQSGQSLLSLVNDILDFSKIEAGKLEMEVADFDPEAEFAGVVATFAPAAQSKNVHLETSFQNLPATVSGDSLRLRQILANLLSNAIKFTPSGRVILSAKGSIEGSRVRLDVSVKDSGIGIPAEKISLLFNPFTQADSSTTRKFGGTGLGLAICSRLVAAMGGAISVESSSEGSNFFFHIFMTPSTSESAHKPAAACLPEDCSTVEIRILLVEDHPINQTVALSVLRRMGRTADCASTGAEAVRMAATGGYDLILMDMQLPEMDGIEATRRIRDLPLPAQPRIVAVTANAFDSDRQACIDAGMDGFLSKPFRAEQLRRIICNNCPLVHP